MNRLTRSAAAIVGVISGGAAIALGAPTVGAQSKPVGAGKPDSGVVYLAVTHTANGNEYLAGNSTDKLFGTGAATYVIKAMPTTPGPVKITANPVTLFFSNGTLTGTATATLTVGAGGAATITNGTLTAANGTESQKGHSVTSTFHGKGSATTGTYTITYTGTYT